MTKTVALYARVSTGEQTVENQLAELRAVAARRAWRVVGEFTDRGISGTKGRQNRPEFDRLLRGVVRHEFDLVAAWSVDRLGRSLQDLVSFLAELHGAGVDLYLDRQGLDTSTPAGRAMFQMLGVFAEFEAAIIRERVRAGIARARTRGTKSGRAIGRPRIGYQQEKKLRVALAKHGIAKAARVVGVGTGTAQRVAREMTLHRARPEAQPLRIRPPS